MSSTETKKILVDIEAIDHLIRKTKNRFSNVKTNKGFTFLQGELQGMETIRDLILGIEK